MIGAVWYTLIWAICAFFNDWYGKREGDALLGEVGDVLRDVEAHGVGFAGHWGQDDFIVCMPFDKKQINGLYCRRILAIVSAHDDAIGFFAGVWRFSA